MTPAPGLGGRGGLARVLWGSCRILDAGDPAVFAHACEWSGGKVLAVHNLADRHACVRLALDGEQPLPMIEMLGDHRRRPPVPGLSPTPPS